MIPYFTVSENLIYLSISSEKVYKSTSSKDLKLLIDINFRGNIAGIEFVIFDETTSKIENNEYSIFDDPTFFEISFKNCQENYVDNSVSNLFLYYEFETLIKMKILK